MRQRALLGITLLCGSVFVACGSSETGNTGGSTTTATNTGGTTTTTTSSTTGTGGTGTTTSSTTTTSGTTTTSSTTTSGTTTSSTGTGGSTPGEHLLISEIGTSPAEGEFIEIYNPTTAAVDLTNYYLSDNATYHRIAAGMPFAPPLATPETDFLAQFPAGTMLPAGGVIVLATVTGFEGKFSKCPDFMLSATPFTCVSGGTAKAMVVPTNGAIGTMVGLSNSREMVVLFSWMPGTTKVQDVDYVTWGDMFDAETRMDKTAVTGYSADTAAASQKFAPAPNVNESIERCGPTAEPAEKATGGNGIMGHDETSESLDVSFKIQAAPSPGVKNACL